MLERLPAGVEAVRRGEVLFVLNHGRDSVDLRVPGAFHDLLTGMNVTDELTLDRYGVAVLKP